MTVKTPLKLSLSYVILYVPHAEEAIPFYRDLFGLKVKHSEPTWVELDAGTTTVALHSADDLPKDRKQERTVLVFSVENIKEAYSLLKANGIKFEKEPQEVCSTPDHVGLSADFQDPYGNHLSIFAMEPKK